jgi:hypothetical protein
VKNGARFEDQLRLSLEASGWRTQAPQDHTDHTDPGFVFIAEKGTRRYAIEVKPAKESRRALLEGHLASAILRARAAASTMNAKPLAVVCAPSISDALLRGLEEFVRRFGEGTCWGAMDGSGLVVLHAPGMEDMKRERRVMRKSPAVAYRSDFLSDLGQWMLKVLLSHRLPPDLRLHAPADRTRIDQPIANAMALARVSAVSIASASRFVACLKEERFAADGAAIDLIRERELLERWRSVLQRRPLELRARWLFPRRDPLEQLEHRLRKHDQESGDRACLGLFAACDRLGFRFVSGVAPHVYLENRSPEYLQRIGLRVAEPGESADVLVRQPRFPESVFRGVTIRDGIPVSDVLQCWLDVADHPARGEEMAAHLHERIIAPNLLGEDG